MPTLMKSVSQDLQDIAPVFVTLETNPLLRGLAQFFVDREAYREFKEFLETDIVKKVQAALSEKETKTNLDHKLDIYFNIRAGIQYGIRFDSEKCQFLLCYSGTDLDYDLRTQPSSTDPAISRMSSGNFQLLQKTGMTIVDLKKSLEDALVRLEATQA